MEFAEQQEILDSYYHLYNVKGFIEHDPILIPHLFIKKEDIEISGFFAAILAWGQRKTIITKCHLLLNLFDNEPFNFVINHSEKELKSLQKFVHRTFNGEDLTYFIQKLRYLYQFEGGLEGAFAKKFHKTDLDVYNALVGFHQLFTDPSQRSRKHIATPLKNATCKRINMFLRWMVRKDDNGVDFGIWNAINTSQLVCPIDVHVERVAHELGLLSSNLKGWNQAVFLTKKLKEFDPNDPVKYDFALFGLGVNGII